MTSQTVMINPSLKAAVAACVLPMLLLSAGCTERREGLGGGARTPVSVTLLREGGESGSGGGGGAAAGPKITEFGTVRGKISVDGAFAGLSPLPIVGGDAICSAQPVPNQTAVVNNGGLANVFIFLKSVPNVDIPAVPEEQAEFDQQGCVFQPHAKVVRVGQPILLKNSDPVAHNVKFNGSANSYANTIAPKSGDVVHKFDFAERKPALVTCDFHTFMSAWVMPVNHPWAVVTNSDGTFEIPNVPAGKMEFVIWHEKLDYIERSIAVDVPANGVGELNVTVNAAKLGG